MSKKIFSILGDSISTFEGYTPARAVFFDRTMASETGIATVGDTWWMQVIDHMDAVCGYNNSMAGCLVTGNISSSGSSMERIASLGKNGSPDVILVALGCNDWAFGVSPEAFEQAYRLMVSRIMQTYPEAQVWCSTLPEGKEVDPVERFFFNIDSRISGKVYSDIIARIAGESGACLADLSDCVYETIDGVHPDKAGMETLSACWIRELEKGK